ARRRPAPLLGRPPASLSNRPVVGERPVPGLVVARERLWILRADRRRLEPAGQALPEEDVVVDVDEGFRLGAVGPELPQYPPLRVRVLERVERRDDRREGEAEVVDQEPRARCVGEEDALGVVPPRE